MVAISAKGAVETLRQNRLLRDRAEVAAFEGALEALVGVADEQIVRELHLVFDDATRHQEVMFGLVHLLESLEMGMQTRVFVQTIQAMAAPEWTRILLIRLLNETRARGCLVEVLRESGTAAREAVQRFLSVISGENEAPISEFAADVLAALEQ